MIQPKSDESCLTRADEFLQLFKKGAEFTQDLLLENERLRFQIVKLEESLKGQFHEYDDQSPASVKLLQKIEVLEKEKAEILDRIKLVEAENADFANRYVEIEEENNMLANLYIASYQLHSTLDFEEVLQIIVEIIINLIGAEEFGVFLLDDKTSQLQPVATEGIDIDECPTMTVGEGVVGQSAKSGESFFIDSLVGYERDFLRPLACVPLKIKEHVIGAVVIYKLLVNKKAFNKIDYELFTLLSGHAATAICASRLYADSKRKLTTIQNFIDLLSE
ncbi:MAG: GAF domain-containing protein [Deltaproteobacteria bacterium]|jgi:nitrate/nitrite-specific signal transduction histidine kinase|nr:GAF domain-containing protein [Deltaproteobacteria bacterium]